MATVSESLAREIIENDGYYSEDPRVLQVVSYDNVFTGERTWAILYQFDVENDRYAPSEYVRNPRIEWEAK